MILTLARYLVSSHAVIGQLFLDGQFQCYTLEDPIRAEKIPGKTCIPVGAYLVGLRHSPKFSPRYKHDMLWVKDVPGFEYILIHKGNRPADTAGCLLVGRKVGDEQTIHESGLAYNALYKAVASAAKAGILQLSIVTLK